MKAWACVGSHSKIFYCEYSSNEQLIGRLEIFRNYKDALKMALSPEHVREVTITIHRPKKTNPRGEK